MAVSNSLLDAVVDRAEVDTAVLGPRDELVGGRVVATWMLDAVASCVEVETVVLPPREALVDRVVVALNALLDKLVDLIGDDAVKLEARDMLVDW